MDVVAGQSEPRLQPPPPDHKKPGWYRYPNFEGWWYWDGKNYVDQAELIDEKSAQRAEEAVAGGGEGLLSFVNLMTWRRNPKSAAFLFVIVVAILMLALTLAIFSASGGNDSTEPVPLTNEEPAQATEPVAGAESELSTGEAGDDPLAGTGDAPQAADPTTVGPGRGGSCAALVMHGFVGGTVPAYGVGATIVDRATIEVRSDCTATIEAHWQLGYEDFCVLFLGLGDATFKPDAERAGTGNLDGKLAVNTGGVPGACPGVDLPGNLRSQLGGGTIDSAAFAEGRYGSYLSGGMPVTINASVFDGIVELSDIAIESTSIPMTITISVSD